uniref:HYDIN/VesB/CFA65-like Ig-like domain-containing protein n=1 Tax=Taeniopygia guttata TaxID=59729 RepID=A0A674HUU2_TAEGU
MILPHCFTAHLNSLCHLLVLGVVLLCSFCFSGLLLFPVRPKCLVSSLAEFLPSPRIMCCFAFRQHIPPLEHDYCVAVCRQEPAGFLVWLNMQMTWFKCSVSILLWQNNRFMSFLQLPEVVRISMESSPYFQLVCSNNAYRVVTPGVPAPVRIRFTPGKGKDYSHKLICTTARERIVVPIQAIGARAILEFPDQLDFSECPVKQSSHKTLLVHNVSNRAVHYHPFSVVPATGTVGAGDTVQVTVGFHALMTGDYSGSLCCNTGECWLHAEAVELNIGLSTNVVAVETTFITMSNHKTMFIENRSNVTAHFQWKAFPTKEGENREKRRLKSQENLTEEETSESEMGSCEDHTARLSNTVLAEIAKVQQDPMLFSDDIFFIEPVEGEIGPNSSAEIKVTFKPTEALEYQSVAYCNISGRESRLPLRLRGHGKGPLVELNCRILNLGNVSVNTPHVREVQLVNLGAIDAPFTYISSNANVGFCFKFAPKEGIIAPGGTQTIQVSFGATVLGTFEEEFQFSVAGSPRPAILTIKNKYAGFVFRGKVLFFYFGNQEGTFHHQIIVSALSLPRTAHGMLLHKQLCP